MANDWIKMQTDLYRNPKVCVMADFLLNQDGELARYINQQTQHNANVTRNVMRNAVIGALLSIWGVMRNAGNRNGDDLVCSYASLSTIDDVADMPGFGEAMESVGWVVDNAERLVFPDFFSEYNTEKGKERSSSARSNSERQKEYRERKKHNESNVTNNVTNNVTRYHREEKRREEIKPQQQPQRAGEAFAKPFVMHGDWKPDLPDGDLIALCQSRGVTLNPLDPVLQTEFRMHWLGTATARTGSQWVNAFVKSLHSQQVINANRDSKLSLVSGQKQSTGFVETHTDRSWAEGM